MERPRSKKLGPSDSEILGAHLLGANLREQFSDAIRQHGLTIEMAAGELGISRATLFNYLGGRTAPKLRVVHLALEKWGVSLDSTRVVVTDRKNRSRRHIDVRQLALPFITALENRDLTVRVERKEPTSFELRLTVRFGAGADS